MGVGGRGDLFCFFLAEGGDCDLVWAEIQL